MTDRRRLFGRCNSEDRGVSVTIEYVLTVSALVALFTGLTSLMFSGIAGTQEDVMAQELDRIGNEVTTGLLEADQLATQAESTGAIEQSTVKLYIELPNGIDDQSYTIRYRNESLIVRSQQLQRSIPVAVTRPIAIEGEAVSGDIWIIYDPSDGSQIRIEGA